MTKRTFHYKPYTPSKPIIPKEYINKEIILKSFHIDNRIYINMIYDYLEEFKDEQAYLQCDDDRSLEMDELEIHLYKTETVLNEHFNKQLEQYNKEMVKYNKEFAIYEKDIKEWEEWNLQKQINEVERQLSALKTSGPQIAALEKTLAELKKK